MRPAPSGIDEFDLNARMRCREQIDLLLSPAARPRPELHRLLRPHCGGRAATASRARFQKSRRSIIRPSGL
jgi:hypothetical protein